MLRWYIRKYADAYVEISDYDGTVIYWIKEKNLYKERLHLGMSETYKYTSKREAMYNMIEKASKALLTIKERA